MEILFSTMGLTDPMPAWARTPASRAATFRMVRSALGVSLARLGDTSSLSPSTLQRLEDADYEAPNNSTVMSAIMLYQSMGAMFSAIASPAVMMTERKPQ